MSFEFIACWVASVGCCMAVDGLVLRSRSVVLIALQYLLASVPIIASVVLVWTYISQQGWQGSFRNSAARLISVVIFLYMSFSSIKMVWNIHRDERE